jgi:hypothetical protein
MGKFDQRHRLLSKIPKIQDNVVSFRKKPKHRNRFRLVMFEADEANVFVLYKSCSAVDENGDRYTTVGMDIHAMP